MSTQDTSPVVSIRDLDIAFSVDAGSVEAVSDVSLDIRRGSILAIVGESGSGKTVTSKSILGLLPETATARGAVLLEHRADAAMRDVISLRGHQLRQIRGADAAMVFQEPTSVLNPVYKIGWQIAEGLRAHGGISRKEARARAIEYLGLVGIPDPAERVDYYPHQFSGGQKQRIVIAMALALRPGLIIADEPTTALDVTVQAEILELLRRCRDEFDATILLITHNMGVVADLADEVAVMHHGRIIEQAPVRELFSHPRQEWTRTLLAAVPRIGQEPPRVLPEEPSSPPETPRRAEAVVAARDMTVEFPGRWGRPPFRAVDGISFEIRPGEVLGLVGESGSGKTTTGRAIAGLQRIHSGSLEVLGHEMRDFSERRFRPVRRDIGFVFQDPGTSFNPQLTIAQCIAEPLVVHGAAEDSLDARPRVDELLEAVQLHPSFGDRFPHELSGGQRQRASLARALALDPKLLIADEPTSALDVSVQARVLRLFRDLQDQLRFACLFITHDLAVVDLVAHEVAVLYRGRIVERGVTRQVLTDPQDPYTQRLIASLPVPDPVEQARRREEFLRLEPGPR
ncbi:MAG: ABC transporter ATP-binding protein [Actinomyces sp.]|jgi:peptide/nickel transport system ATP-binding protein|nr:ABC transporter ATP-binding protein [Actinomyces sp.]MCI1640948.1 ABC transporter ATP-binding protein [Actinomyces sp.]MCI1661316.1 ABC transporter ATP-binding protein [Actinomyces sp.]MCI1690324.1 ABC transporter ATP-binding protein [Actinomyces sp.]MCI1786965.1 ABC transporter ATP-binding protein [Actinomyces sp.]MCI1829469.1 ABC transporter ATP-binding protein [Actinomyces sp.]